MIKLHLCELQILHALDLNPNRVVVIRNLSLSYVHVTVTLRLTVSQSVLVSGPFRDS